jgi:betaine lipid synthase
LVDKLIKELVIFLCMNHLKTLYNLWFHPPTGVTHAEKLENFYAKQVNDYDDFRKYLLWAREDMLKACALRFEGKSNLVWVDLGGGTGENIEMMSKYINLSCFKKIYVVDLCHSMCEKAKERVQKNKWTNVQVIESDAAIEFLKEVNLVTFSYSLSMMPTWLKVIDSVKRYLLNDGIIAICDFGINHKYEMSWFRRFFWRSIFDIDNIDIGPERRDYLKHRFHTHWEYEGQGSIPYVPYLRAPYYIWLGSPSPAPLSIAYKKHPIKINHPSFLYHMSWEDPKEDEKYMDWNDEDVVLTLSSGGCNLFELLLHDVKEVVAVDVNKAQTALVELKLVSFMLLPYDTIWKLFGEGVYLDIEKLYHNLLKYYLSIESNAFWSSHLYYFKTGLYNHGGMGNLSYYVRKFFVKPTWLNQLFTTTSLSEQYSIWNALPLVKVYKSDNSVFKKIVSKVMSNKYLCWFGLGVPFNQLQLLDSPVYDYLYRTLDPLFKNKCMKANYFYYNIFTGHFEKDCCPDYLKPENYEFIKQRVNRIKLVNNTFLDELNQNLYTKVILMDHIDWMDESYATELKEALIQHTSSNARIQWRSAAQDPFYKSIFLGNDNFTELVHIIRTKQNPLLDQVNMYAHYCVIEKV